MNYKLTILKTPVKTYTLRGSVPVELCHEIGHGL